MNLLLLEKIHANPIYINGFYISVAGAMIPGILLEYIMKKLSMSSQFETDSLTMINDTILLKDDMAEALKKLKKLSFLTIKNDNDKYIFSIDRKKYELFLENLS